MNNSKELEKKGIYTFSDFINSLTLYEYIKIFGTYWDKEEKKTKKFKLWPSQIELCKELESERFNIIGKARQLGISEIAGEFSIKMVYSGSRVEVIVLSKDENAAKYFLQNRIVQKLRNMPKIQGITYPSYKVYKEIIEFGNGSSIRSLASGERAAASFTSDVIIYDEAGQMNNLESIWSASAPTLEKAKGYAWLIGTSSPGSFFNNKIREVLRGDNQLFKLHFLPWYADPSRDRKTLDLEKQGYADEVRFRREFPETIEDMFLYNEGLVFKNFDPRTDGPHVRSIDVQKLHNYLFYVGYDHGYRHYAATLFAFYDPFDDIIYVYDEFFVKEEEIPSIATEINSRIYQIPKPPHKKIADTSIFNKTGFSKTIADVFKDHGIRWQKSDKYDAASSRALLSDRFTFNRIVIDPNCHILIDQISNWRWKNTDNNKEIPEDKEDDGIDVLRYLCAEIRKQYKPKEIKKNYISYNSKNNRSILKPEHDCYETITKNPNGWQAA